MHKTLQKTDAMETETEPVENEPVTEPDVGKNLDDLGTLEIITKEDLKLDSEPVPEEKEPLVDQAEDVLELDYDADELELDPKKTWKILKVSGMTATMKANDLKSAFEPFGKGKKSVVNSHANFAKLFRHVRIQTPSIFFRKYKIFS